MYDFGTRCISMAEAATDARLEETCNQAKYGQTEPPFYDLSKVTVKAAVFEGVCACMRGGPAPGAWGAARGLHAWGW